MAAAFAENAFSDVAVLFSGWLNVVIPDRGAQARASLIDPLSADVIIAGTYRASDCPGVKNERGLGRHQRGQCLISRIRGLQPVAKLSLRPMLNMRKLGITSDIGPSTNRNEPPSYITY